MKTSILLPLLTAVFLLPGASLSHAGETADAPVRKPIPRRAAPISAAPAAPVVRRDSRQPAPTYIEVRVARVRPVAPWAPGAPGD